MMRACFGGDSRRSLPKINTPFRPLSAKSSRRKLPIQLPDAGESRAAVAVTVVWMLTCMSTAVAMLVIAALWVLSYIFPFHGRAHPLIVVATMLLFVAATTGVLCLGFTPLAYRVRLTAPPRAIAIAAVLIALSPLVTFVVLALQSR